jgi:hypothetical protein
MNNKLSIALAFVFCGSAVLGAVPVNTGAMKNFGHSIKNGHLIANEEIVLFEHTCTNPPCTITQMHCPTAGPKGWYDVELRLYVDDDPVINMTLLELGNIGNPTDGPPVPPVLPNFTEYYLGAEGKTCAEACSAKGLTCSPHINVGYGVDEGEHMIKYLSKFNQSILNCTRDPKPWWAPDQPGYVCGNDPNGNTNKCVGWKDIHDPDSCSGKYPAQCRVCRCLDSATFQKEFYEGAPRADPGTGDKGPWGVGLFGHTAANGGVYSTIRVPFGKKLRATLTGKQHGTFWFIIRGVENYPVILGDMQLPASARLRLHRFENATKNLDLVTIADVPSGTAGALLNVRFDAAGGSYGYLEACMRAMIDGATTPLFLSSGAEDYFLSAYYFNEGEFKNPNSGLTFFDGKGTLSAYKTHDRDPVLWSDSLKLIFRNCESTTGCGDLNTCPNQFCAPNATAIDYASLSPKYKQSLEISGDGSQGNTDAYYKTAVWTYEWPKGSEEASAPATDVPDCLRFVVQLGAAGLLDASTESAMVRAITSKDAQMLPAVLAYAQHSTQTPGSMARAAEVLSALLKQA